VGGRSRRLAAQFVEERFCLLEIGGIEAFGEPAIDRREKVAGFNVLVLVATEPGEAHGGTQFPELGLLFLGDTQSLPIEFLGGLRMALCQQQPTLAPVQLRSGTALSCFLGDL